MLNPDEFECGCCYDLLLNPTTLTCGHSFCRYCLAKWFKTSNKTECPECRQTWTGFPQVNIHLRSIIEKSFPEKTKVRVKSQKTIRDYHKTLKHFEEHAKKGEVQNGAISEEQVKVWIGLAFLLIAVVAILLLIGGLYWIFFAESQPREVIYSKSVRHWSVKEVVSWVQIFSDQLGQDYSQRFEKAGINGELLLSLDDEDLLSPPLDIFTALHRKVLFAEIMKLAAAGVKQANDLWEYKNANRVSAVFMEFMLQDFPRLTILYHRFLYYDSVWLPFVRAVTDNSLCGQDNVEDIDEDNIYDEEDDTAKSKCSTLQVEITSREKLWLYTKIFLFPYYLISQFAWHYIDIHFFTIWIIISHCVMLTFRELLQIRKVNISLRKLINSIIDSTLAFIVSCVLYRIAIIFIPGIALDLIFYAKLYYGPLDTAGSIRNGHLQRNAIAKVLGVVFGVVEKCLQFIRALFNAGARHV